MGRDLSLVQNPKLQLPPRKWCQVVPLHLMDVDLIVNIGCLQCSHVCAMSYIIYLHGVVLIPREYGDRKFSRILIMSSSVIKVLVLCVLCDIKQS